ncbi:unnamed protein product [Mycena citricolor]|uniref:Uncharacterized protein n=1 Tax=Mycena citricolor TaxID=2018698 RepID=A0AAD2HWM8_9AGAR|nr:unnamed protein product [Mycena citricolor]
MCNYTKPLFRFCFWPTARQEKIVWIWERSMMVRTWLNFSGTHCSHCDFSGYRSAES